MTAKLAIFGASLVAIILVAALTRWLGLGDDARIRNAGDACRLAQDVDAGFTPVDMAIDRAGMGALLRDGDGRYLLLRRHGAHFFGRILDGHSHCRLDRETLTIGTGERFDKPVTLNLGPAAQVWAARFRDMARVPYA